MSARWTEHLVVSGEAVVEQIVLLCYLFRARGGDPDGARALAERVLERLLKNGLAHKRGPNGSLLLDPYSATRVLRTRRGESADDCFEDWVTTARRNAASLPSSPHLYRLNLVREWHAFSGVTGRPLVFRMPLPLRGAQRGEAQARLLEPSGGLVELRTEPGRVEFRVDPSAVRGPVIAELEVSFSAAEEKDPGLPSSPLGELANGEDEPWLRSREGLIAPSARVKELAKQASAKARDARELLDEIWRILISTLHFGDVHRGDLDSGDPLSSVLELGVADCVLASSLLVALCRSSGVPARLVSGFLLHPANLGPHSWAEAKVGPGCWAPFDLGAWCCSAGDATDPVWGGFFRGRVNARFVGEVVPREFTGWGSAPPPAAWFRLERLRGDRIEHTLHREQDGALVRRDLLDLRIDSLSSGASASPPA